MTTSTKRKSPAQQDIEIGQETRLELYRMQLELRYCEKRAYDLFLQNLIKGTSHLSLGQEAIAAGFGVAMRPDDWTFCTYRGHAHTLARGASMEGVLGELMGKQCGLLGGKGGSMHLADVTKGAMGSYAIIGAHLPIAAGAAWSAQYRGTKQVAVCFFGDGTTNIGAFHEALYFSVVWTLPPERARELAVLDDEAFCQRLRDAFGGTLGAFSAPSRRLVFALALKYAPRPIAQRTVLIGNAAQTLHPVAGQGFNLGLRDAWELARAISACRGPDVGVDAVLHAYFSRRRFDRIGTILFTDSLIRLFRKDIPPLAHARSLALAAFSALPGAKTFLSRRMLFGIHG